MESETLTVLGAFLVSALALVRYNLTQQKSSLDRVLGSFESALRMHQDSNRRFADVIEELSRQIREAISRLNLPPGASA